MSYDEPPLPSLRSSWINRAVFLGTGTSSQVPEIGCLLPHDADTEERALDASAARCKTCHDAMTPGSKNRRGCTSIIVVGGGRQRQQSQQLSNGASAANGHSKHSNSVQGSRSGGGTHNRIDEGAILIDCGPTFYASAVTNFRRHRLRTIDAVLLTHAHADAILGLDNLRAWTMRSAIQESVDIYCTSECFESVKSAFPYLVDASQATGEWLAAKSGTLAVGKTCDTHLHHDAIFKPPTAGSGLVVDLKFHIISPDESFRLPMRNGESVEVVPLPVWHGSAKGKPFQALGFRIDSLSYISDCHHVPASTAKLVAGSDAVIIDALNRRWTLLWRVSYVVLIALSALLLTCVENRLASLFCFTAYRHPSHFSLAQALSFVLSLPGQPPRLSLLTDMTHNFEHDALETALQDWRTDLQAWVSQQLRSGVQDIGPMEAGTKSPATPLKTTSTDAGEGSGPRWWHPKWDEARAEGLRGSSPAQLLQKSLRHRDAKTRDGGRQGVRRPSQSLQASMPTFVPEVHVAWDGLAFTFTRADVQDG